MSEDPKILRPADLPVYKPGENETVAKSIAKPTAFAKPGTMENKGTRFRPLVAKNPPRRARKRKPDRRYVRFY